MWTPLTETILNQVLNAGELASVTRDRAQVQPDPIPGILAETAAQQQKVQARLLLLIQQTASTRHLVRSCSPMWLAPLIKMKLVHRSNKNG